MSRTESSAIAAARQCRSPSVTAAAGRGSVGLLVRAGLSAVRVRSVVVDSGTFDWSNGCFPVIADPDRTISELYGMIHPNASETFTVRSVFIIDPAKKTINASIEKGTHEGDLLPGIYELNAHGGTL